MSLIPTPGYDIPSYEAIAGYYTGMRPFWYPVLPEDELLPAQPVPVELLGELIVLVQLNSQPVALQDLCRHFQARLSMGEVVEHQGQECLMCPYHGWTYAATGQCVKIPQLAPGREIPAGAQVQRYATQKKYGLIWVCLDETPKFDIPEFPEFNQPAFRLGPLRSYDPWQVSAPRLIMGTLDDTHFPWVHPGLLGDRNHPEPPDHKVWREGQYLMSEYSILEPPNVTTSEAPVTDRADGWHEVTYTNYVGMPHVIRLVKSGSYGTYVIWGATVPHRYNLTSTYWRVARNYNLNPDQDQSYEDFQDQVRAQDKPILEGQRPWLLPPFWTKIELPLRPADLPLIEYQKWLEELQIAVNV